MPPRSDTADDTRPTCATCRFFDPMHDAVGLCLRFPSYSARSVGDWCGEYATDAAEKSTVPLSAIAKHYSWSTRLRNCLLSDIPTLGDLLQHTEAELMERSAFGPVCLAELRRTLDALGVTLCQR